MSKLKEYTVYMQWDSYEDSLFVETSTTWVMAYNRTDAENRARSQYGHHNGFRING